MNGTVYHHLTAQRICTDHIGWPSKLLIDLGPSIQFVQLCHPVIKFHVGVCLSHIPDVRKSCLQLLCSTTAFPPWRCSTNLHTVLLITLSPPGCQPQPFIFHRCSYCHWNKWVAFSPSGDFVSIRFVSLSFNLIWDWMELYVHDSHPGQPI